MYARSQGILSHNAIEPQVSLLIRPSRLHVMGCPRCQARCEPRASGSKPLPPEHNKLVRIPDMLQVLLLSEVLFPQIFPGLAHVT